MELYFTVRILDAQTYQEILQHAKKVNQSPDEVVFRALRFFLTFLPQGS